MVKMKEKDKITEIFFDDGQRVITHVNTLAFTVSAEWHLDDFLAEESTAWFYSNWLNRKKITIYNARADGFDNMTILEKSATANTTIEVEVAG